MNILDKHNSLLTSFTISDLLVGDIPLMIQNSIIIGVPKNQFIDFSIEGHSPEIKKYKSKNYLVIGHDEATSIAIDFESAGVYSIDFGGELATRFINSDLKSLTACLLLYQDSPGKIIESTDDTIELILEELKSEFLCYDPQVFNDPENWWSVIFEEISSGIR